MNFKIKKTHNGSAHGGQRSSSIEKEQMFVKNKKTNPHLPNTKFTYPNTKYTPQIQPLNTKYTPSRTNYISPTTKNTQIANAQLAERDL